ncbi:MAG: glycosyltransferase family 9 protein [Bacteroidales bacterium]
MVNKYRNILVIQTASIGDVILVTPVIEELHSLYPAASIDILVKKGTETLFEGHPFLRKVWVWNKREKKYTNLFRLIRQLRKQHYDLTLNAQRFLSAGMITVFSGSKFSSGFDKNPLSFFFNKRVPHIIGSGDFHEAERNLSLIPGKEVFKGSASICLYPSAEDYRAVEAYQGRPYITLSPASLWFTKQYPAEKWTEFLHALQPGYVVYCLGSKADVDLAEGIMRKAGRENMVNLCGKLSLLQSAALMEGAAMNYVNDSAPLHLCSSRNAPVTAVFCSTVSSFGFGPYGSRGTIVESREKLACRPCGLHGRNACPEKHFLCAYNIKKEDLLNTLS